MIKSKFLSVSSMNTLLVILKVTGVRRDIIPAGGLYHRFSWTHLPPLLVRKQLSLRFVQVYLLRWATVVSGLIVFKSIGSRNLREVGGDGVVLHLRSYLF